MNVLVTMTEAEFDEYRKQRQCKLDPVKLHRAIVDGMARLVQDNLRVQGILTRRDLGSIHMREVQDACHDIRVEIDNQFRAAGVKV